jgi:pyruvate/2-oxoglutarate dehydrogenase complex dihydrolipoamide acyltransferase (E2) component
MKELVNLDDREWTIPELDLHFNPGQAHAIGDGRGQVSPAIAGRYDRSPKWKIRDAANTPGGDSVKAIKASQGALTAAEAAGLDLAVIAITGTGKDGQIIKGDVDAFVAAAKEAAENKAGDQPAGN